MRCLENDFKGDNYSLLWACLRVTYALSKSGFRSFTWLLATSKSQLRRRQLKDTPRVQEAFRWASWPL